MNVKEFLTGKFSKRFLTRVYMPIILLQLLIFYLLALSYYDSYDLVHMDISFLGAPGLNPNGWIYWAMGMAVTGVLTFPIIPYLYRLLIQLKKPIAIIGSFLLTCFAIGMIGLGAIPQYHHLMLYHGISTSLAFGGLYLAILLILSFFVFKFKWIKTKMNLSIGILILLIVLEILPILGAGISQGFRIFQGIDLLTDRNCLGGVICSWYMSLSFWEWMMFLGVIANLNIFLYVFPEKFFEENEH
jgi:Protein of unknown function (DUF998)